ncbi:hypothetical protein RLIN73S_05844 [Rhodanobacter lindaniclasticus]
MQPPSGAAGEYTVNADCTGSVRFLDASGVAFTIYVESFGDTIRMIQTNPSNNVFEGTARRGADQNAGVRGSPAGSSGVPRQGPWHLLPPPVSRASLRPRASGHSSAGGAASREIG